MLSRRRGKRIEAAAPDIKTVQDLKNADCLRFRGPSKGRLYGAISDGRVIRFFVRSIVPDLQFYNYLDPGSDAALAAAIASAYEKGDMIAAYYWEPTWITGQYDLVLLEDEPFDPELYAEGRCAFPSNRVTVAVNTEFLETAPEFCEFLGSYVTSSQLTAGRASTIFRQTNASYAEAADGFDRTRRSYRPVAA
jgi:glycine betaine/proline transport system permease protein/glycine betaine/proline transport system substrate-binding protein